MQARFAIAIIAPALLVFSVGGNGQPILSDPRTHVVEAPNFKGRNVCMKVSRVVPLGRDYARALTPKLTMVAEIGREDDFSRSARYTISVGDLGEVTVDEAVALDHRCARLPIDRFAWNDDRGGQSANAHFCLSSANGQRKIEVSVTLQATGSERQRVKSALVGVAACQNGTNFPSEFYAEDKYTIGDRLQMGPYILAYTP
jgi:hypothetical protein